MGDPLCLDFDLAATFGLGEVALVVELAHNCRSLVSDLYEGNWQS